MSINKITGFEFDDFLQDISTISIQDHSKQLVKRGDIEYQIVNKSDFAELVRKIDELNPKTLAFDPIIFGKNQDTRIVNVSIDDTTAHIFQEMPDGSIVETVKPMTYWILAPMRPSTNGVRLKGSQHFCWKKEFRDNASWQAAKMSLYRRQADFFTINTPAEMYMVTEGITYFKGMQVSDVSILSFDIETSTLDKDADDALVFLISNTYRDTKGNLVRKLFSIDDYNGDDSLMIEDWCTWVRKMNPSILLGHNIYSFDLPYLHKRAGNGLRLGRDESKIKFANKSSEKRIDCSTSYTYYRVECFGREIIDTFFLALTYDTDKKYESYALKKIIKQEGLEKEGRSFVDAGQIRIDWYTNKRDLIKQYAIEDADDSMKLYDFMIPAQYYFSQTVSKTFQGILNGASGGSINNIMTRIYYQDGYSLPKKTDLFKIEGGISFGIPGVRKNVMMIDIISAYPHIILQYELYDRVKDPKKYFLYITKFFLEFRLKNKKLFKETGNRYYDDVQKAFKIGANSLFGALGAELMFNSPYNCAQITRYGRETLSKIIKFLTNNDIEQWKEKDDDEELDE